MGGAEGFRRLVHKGQGMGFKFRPMFGLNCATRYQRSSARWSEGQHRWPDGAAHWIEFVDWDDTFEKHRAVMEKVVERASELNRDA